MHLNFKKVWGDSWKINPIMSHTFYTMNKNFIDFKKQYFRRAATA